MTTMTPPSQETAPLIEVEPTHPLACELLLGPWRDAYERALSDVTRALFPSMDPEAQVTVGDAVHLCVVDTLSRKKFDGRALLKLGVQRLDWEVLISQHRPKLEAVFQLARRIADIERIELLRQTQDEFRFIQCIASRVFCDLLDLKRGCL